MFSHTTSLTDPPANSPIVEGVIWVENATLGSTAATIAVIAVASIGLLMLSGRLELRRGITMVLGCFLLFGVAGIGTPLTGLNGTDALPLRSVEDFSQLSGQLRSATPSSSAYDPYAGASVPVAQ